jgi:hypothetical protein
MYIGKHEVPRKEVYIKYVHRKALFVLSAIANSCFFETGFHIHTSIHTYIHTYIHTVFTIKCELMVYICLYFSPLSLVLVFVIRRQTYICRQVVEE